MKLQNLLNGLELRKGKYVDIWGGGAQNIWLYGLTEVFEHINHYITQTRAVSGLQYDTNFHLTNLRYTFNFTTIF